MGNILTKVVLTAKEELDKVINKLNLIVEENKKLIEGNEVAKQADLDKLALKVNNLATGGVNGGSIETAEIINGTLALRVGNFYVNMKDNTTITLPSVTEHAEIRLYFKCSADLNIIFPNVAWQDTPKTSKGFIYEYIFTCINGDWCGGFIEYGVA